MYAMFFLNFNLLHMFYANNIFLEICHNKCSRLVQDISHVLNFILIAVIFKLLRQVLFE